MHFQMLIIVSWLRQIKLHAVVGLYWLTRPGSKIRATIVSAIYYILSQYLNDLQLLPVQSSIKMLWNLHHWHRFILHLMALQGMAIFAIVCRMDDVFYFFFYNCYLLSKGSINKKNTVSHRQWVPTIKLEQTVLRSDCFLREHNDPQSIIWAYDYIAVHHWIKISTRKCSYRVLELKWC